MIARMLVLAALLALSGCFRDGGGTEDTNDLKLSGRVLEAGEKAVAGARIVLAPMAAGAAGAESTLTDARGAFAFPAVEPGRYLLIVRVTAADGADREVARKELDLSSGRDTELPPFSAVLAMHWARRADLVLAPAGTGSVADFPLLVRLAGADFPAGAREGGKDIRFAEPDGTPLAYEIERWDAAAGRADIWVRLDSVRLEEGAALRMYWGNPSAEDISRGSDVFDSAAGFAGAWHMAADSTGTWLPDASAARNHGNFRGTAAAASTAGTIGGAMAFDGQDQFVSTAKSHSDPDAFTLSLWFRADTAGGKLAGFESLQTGLGGNFDRHIWLDDAGRLHFGVFPPAPAVITAADSPFVRTGIILPGENPDRPDIQRIISGTGNHADGAWHQATAVLSPEGQYLYVDGALAAAAPGVTDAAAYSGYWRLGGGSLGDWVGRSGSGFFRGAIDEASVSLRARDAAWIRLAYLTQAPGSAAIAIKPSY